MPKVKEVSYSVARTISRDYNSYRVQVGTVVEVNESTPNIAFRIAKSFVDQKLKEEIGKIKEKV